VQSEGATAVRNGQALDTEGDVSYALSRLTRICSKCVGPLRLGQAWQETCCCFSHGSSSYNRPRVSDPIAFGPRVVRVEHELMRSRDPRSARKSRHDCIRFAQRSQRVDSSFELGANDRPRAISAAGSITAAIAANKIFFTAFPFVSLFY